MKENEVLFFEQGMLPAVDLEGRIVIKDKNTVFFAPNGNGGLYLALRDKKVLTHL